MYWLIGRKLQLSLENNILLYKIILKPIWSYGILWGTAGASNMAIIKRFQNKLIRNMVDSPYYIYNDVIQRDVQLPSVTEVITQLSVKYSVQLMTSSASEVRRLKRHQPENLLNIIR